jgi:hypothetical protein
MTRNRVNIGQLREKLLRRHFQCGAFYSHWVIRTKRIPVRDHDAGPVRREMPGSGNTWKKDGI